MKNFLIYIAGILTGVILTILALFLIAHANNSDTPIEEKPGITLFDEPGERVEAKKFEVFQVINKGAALANSEENGHFYGGPVVLLINDEGKLYYDDEIIKVSKGQNARQVGIYQYSTKMGYKTVPIVKIMK